MAQRDKIHDINFRQTVRRLLEERATWYNQSPSSNIKTYPVFDSEHDHYLLLDVGRENNKRVRSIVVYVRLEEDKIWVEEDWTDESIADALVEAGIPKSNIVLGFKPPELRPFTQFATS
ncbi:MAG: XisI protein [Symploca sp. SIO1C4]|uniref:XisI protein n=1 Tax=Symploca sp. SIO1C4 TaxID=2607765 RepID=A0A6B3NPZ2_9CYAN|nr:XisI protein [Symploca sp. SIO1C4]